MRTSVALAKLQSSAYTLSTVKHTSPRVWIQQMLHLAKAANIESVYNQLTLVWNQLHYTLRRDVPEPTQYTTLRTFLEHVDAKSSIWQEMADRQEQYQQSRQPQYHQQQYQRQQPQYDKQRYQARPPPRGEPPPKISTNNGKSTAYLADYDADGVGYYAEEDQRAMEALDEAEE